MFLGSQCEETSKSANWRAKLAYKCYMWKCFFVPCKL